MGMRGPFSSSSADYSTPNPNPDPMNFELHKRIQVGNNVVCTIHYPDCTNFKGFKICVFKDMTIKELNKLKEIDPHFYDSKNSPFARFKPIKEGWEAALLIAENI